MQNKEYLRMLGLARRAGRLSMGHDTALKSLKERKARLVIFASDMSPRLVSEFETAKQKANSKAPFFQTKECINDFFDALGYRAGVIAVNDENFADKTIELINQEENAYGN